MRVCFISRRFFPAISGMSIYAANLLRELVAAGCDVTMVSQFYGGGHATVYGGGPPPEVPGVRVIGLEALGEQGSGEQAGGDFERDIAVMVDTVAAEHARAPFDIIHAQYGYPNGWAALLASRRLGVPNLVSIQGGDGHWVGSCCETHRLAMVRVIEHAGACLIGGMSFVEEVVERLHVPRERFTLVPGAVDTTRFHPTPEREAFISPRSGGEYPQRGGGGLQLDTEAPGEPPPPSFAWSPSPAPLRGPGEDVRLFYHGRVDRRKGVLDFIEACALLRDRGVDFAATVSGIGPDVEPARALAAERGLGENRMRFSGYAEYDAAPALYRAHDVFVSPTYAEGFSNTVLEAMASGLPIVSCRAVGVTDCLRDGENALLVEPGDVVAQADAIVRLLTDAGLSRRLAADALAECRATYSWEVVGRRILAEYERLAGTAPDLSFDPDLPLTPCRFRQTPHLL